MMKRAITLNALLALVAVGLAGYVVWEAVRPAPAARPPRIREAAPPAPTPLPAPERPSAPGAYGIIASRSLFTPTRNEALATAAGGTTGSAVQVPKPNLYGVVLREGAPLAYLEDPVTKRVAGYRIGDTVAGGTLKSIDADKVVLARPEGAVDVRLHDPGKPRPAVPAAPAQVPGAPVPPTVPQLPGVIPPVSQPVAPLPSQVQGPMPPGVPLPPTVTPGRRPLPPSLLRRFQQNQPANAPTQ